MYTIYFKSLRLLYNIQVIFSVVRFHEYNTNYKLY